MSEISLPNDFVTRVESDTFFAPDFLPALDTKSPNSLRLNPQKSTTHLQLEKQVPWCEHAFYLKDRPKYTLDPLFHAGCYYPQEAGSMFLDVVLKQLNLPEQPICLDLCAAPGGKSTLIASFLAGKGLLVSNEVIQSRSKILKENMTKWGYTNVLVSNNDPADFERLPNFFDVLVIDAPCSGEGMFRKDPQARNEWSCENVELCAGRQKRIVMDCWDSLKENGYLIYSTCTFNASENEDNVHWFLNELDAELIEISQEYLQVGRGGIGVYALPNLNDTEGFYLAVFRKKSASKNSAKRHKKVGLSTVKDTTFLEKWINLNEVTVLSWNEHYFAIPSSLQDEFAVLQQHLRIVKMGTELGDVVKKGLLPNEALALNPSLLHAAIQRIELTLDQALHYLKGETFSLDAPIGTHLVCHQGNPLGWIKHLGNRFNNLYPKEWRIRMKI
jgi:16S rRNA C967 or C1407 C5-methylase (RsmB/RsmF family)/NOL1/NOP2/fmu family ribosome biogenesis protein